MSTALSIYTTASDSYSISSFASQSRFVTVFNVCTVSLQSFDITPLKSFLLIIIIITDRNAVWDFDSRVHVLYRGEDRTNTFARREG